MHVFSLFKWYAGRRLSLNNTKSKQGQSSMIHLFSSKKLIYNHGNTQRIRNASDFELDKKNILVYLTRVKVPCFI